MDSDFDEFGEEFFEDVPAKERNRLNFYYGHTEIGAQPQKFYCYPLYEEDFERVDRFLEIFRNNLDNNPRKIYDNLMILEDELDYIYVSPTCQFAEDRKNVLEVLNKYFTKIDKLKSSAYNKF